jgi:hypothetical protein
MTSNNLEIVRKVYGRPTTSQALIEVLKDYIQHEPSRKKATPEGEVVEMRVEPEVLVAMAKKDVAAEAKDRSST